MAEIDVECLATTCCEVNAIEWGREKKTTSSGWKLSRLSIAPLTVLKNKDHMKIIVQHPKTVFTQCYSSLCITCFTCLFWRGYAVLLLFINVYHSELLCLFVFLRFQLLKCEYFLDSSMTVNWMSLSCGQNKTFEDVIINIFHHFLTFYRPNN